MKFGQKKLIRFLVAIFFVCLTNLSGKFFNNEIMEFAFNILCIGIALSLSIIDIISWLNKEKNSIQKKNKMIVVIGFLGGVILFIVVIYILIVQLKTIDI